MQQSTLIPHLFRTEYRKITSVLCKLFGISHIEVAEDIASETFVAALETWSYKGVPENPTAWLYTVAKNKARNYFTRNHFFTEKVLAQLKNAEQINELPEIDLSNQNINDSQLQMLFAICHPAISTEAQIGLALRILCGFGIDEIASAFLTNKETINKRLFRAKEKLRAEKVPVEFPGNHEINNRLDNVLITLYLLFNEGYYSESSDTVVRNELCLEAMRLTHLLIENQQTNQPTVKALFALMCFHASRFEARKNENGALILYHEQDENLWNYELITKGGYYLQQAAQGNSISRYHLEASIAYWHTVKTDTKEKWKNILYLFDLLLQTDYSPIAALNRVYAISKVKGNAAAIAEAEAINLTHNHFYFTLLGELYKDSDISKAMTYYNNAITLAKTQTDKHSIQQKIDQLIQVNRNN
ncbi:RNA polymerase sigma factor [soil metagenome]